MKKIGDMVWFEEKWSGNIIKSIIVDVENINDTKIYKLKMITIPGSINQLEENLFDSEEACCKFIQNRENVRMRKIKDEIKTVEDLVCYMYRHNIGGNEEYTDYTARKAVLERAKELLNIDMESH